MHYVAPHATPNPLHKVAISATVTQVFQRPGAGFAAFAATIKSQVNDIGAQADANGRQYKQNNADTQSCLGLGVLFVHVGGLLILAERKGAQDDNHGRKPNYKTTKSFGGTGQRYVGHLVVLQFTAYNVILITKSWVGPSLSMWCLWTILLDHTAPLKTRTPPNPQNGLRTPQMIHHMLL